MRCPRCHTETGDPASALCPRCLAPLRLGDDAPLRPLDLEISMDRRGGGSRAPGGERATRGAPARPAGGAELARAEAPEWFLGNAAVAAQAEPLPAPRAEAPAPRPEPLPAPPPAALPAALPAPTGAAPAAEDGDELAVDVDAVEVRLRRPATWRRITAGAVDALPFAAAGIAFGRSVLRDATAGLPAPGGGLDGLLDLLARERAIVVSVGATVILALTVYATLAHALAGATLGKRLLGLRVVGPDGARPSLGRSAWRAAFAVISGALLGLGFHLALFTRSGRALHDLAARTWVVEAP